MVPPWTGSQTVNVSGLLGAVIFAVCRLSTPRRMTKYCEFFGSLFAPALEQVFVWLLRTTPATSPLPCGVATVALADTASLGVMVWPRIVPLKTTLDPPPPPQATAKVNPEAPNIDFIDMRRSWRTGLQRRSSIAPRGGPRQRSV